MGATSGLGLGLARAFVGRGWRVGVAGRDAAALARLVDEAPESVVARGIDVNAPSATDGLKRLVEDMGGMDVYLHVAGIGFDNPSLEPGEEMAMVETNAVGFARMVGEAFRWFRDRNGGRGELAAITSVAGTDGIGVLAAYSSTKGFQQMYLRALDQLRRMEGLSIRVTDIRPGWVDTPLLDPSRHYPMGMSQDYAVERIVQAVERGRRVAVVDWRWRLLTGLWRLLPAWLWVRIPVKTPPVCSRREQPGGGGRR